MSLIHKLSHEVRAVLLTTLYFAAWFGGLVVLKWLVLAEYQIRFHGLSIALFGALVVAKVVLVFQHVPLGAWVRSQPAWVDVALRTGLYASGVFLALVAEKAFEIRHEHGGFGPALSAVFTGTETHHVVATTLCVTSALAVYNALDVIQRHMGSRSLWHVFVSPIPEPDGKGPHGS